MIIPELHGKHYYMVLQTYQEVVTVQDLIISFDVLDDETFTITKHPYGYWILYSDAKCGEFRGPKYRAWEKIKSKIYRSRR